MTAALHWSPATVGMAVVVTKGRHAGRIGILIKRAGYTMYRIQLGPDGPFVHAKHIRYATPAEVARHLPGVGLRIHGIDSV